jgi:GrpB-like predicted nucleotidyltransferase (UPF0157 family)
MTIPYHSALIDDPLADVRRCASVALSTRSRALTAELEGLYKDTMLGVKPGTARIEQHSPLWAELFLQEKQAIARALGPLAIDIQHIGSTAVPGLAAKPILDIGIAVGSREDVARCIPPLLSLGYRHLGHRSEQMGEVFEKLGPSGWTHCIHIVEVHSPHWGDYLLLRDYLKTSHEARESYEHLKREFAERYALDRRAYTAGKAELIQELLVRARGRSPRS